MPRKSRTLSPPVRIGLLGGGQLARMLALEGHALGLRMHVLSSAADDPAAQVTAYWQQGDPSSETDLRRFMATVDVCTFESEFMDADLLARIARDMGKTIFPNPALMATLQDRKFQKELLDQYGLPTAPWTTVTNLNDLEKLWIRFKGPFVLKRRRFGYDGYGTYIIRHESDIDDRRARISTLERGLDHGFIAEQFIAFKSELAVIAGRSTDGSRMSFPFVESKQENARCLWVKGPVNTAATRKLAARLGTFLGKIDYVGVMGIELFQTPKGLLVNELAPRVHNTGHYSQNALGESQFAAHLKAILGLPLSEPKALSKGFAMWNLLGSHDRPPRLSLTTTAALHWYGKSHNRPGRKMGHLNALGSTPEMALKKAKLARRSFDL